MSSPVPAQVAHDSPNVRKRARPTLLELGSLDPADDTPSDTPQVPIVLVKEVRFVLSYA